MRCVWYGDEVVEDVVSAVYLHIFAKIDKWVGRVVFKIVWDEKVNGCRRKGVLPPTI